jgi:hypothetical protein
MQFRHAFRVSFLALAAWSCGGGLRVANIASSAEKPANVMVFLSVDAEKTPVPGLGEEAFKVFEDGVPVTADLRIVNPDMTATQFTVLLLDWSGHVTASDAGAMIDGAAALMAKLRPKQKVAVYAFDGSPDLHPVVAFSAPDDRAKASLEALKDYKPQDETSNLNGAVAGGMKALRAALGESDPLTGGQLVVVARGSDRAARTKREQLQELFKAPETAKTRRFAIGVGEDAKLAQLDSIGTNDTIYVANAGALSSALEGLGERLGSFAQSNYFISFCSGARAGQHELRVEVSRKIKTEKGGEVEQTGRLTQKFSADGFGGGCKPKIPEEFAALLPKEPKESPDASTSR